ncbi:hypothetical protein EV421DRAFT_1966409 [Armillaria borealis]|uniref:Uncharacterized protein n=1 Tax=Armillaria borealis TaxID=47425 RepID=A0AA39JAI6_9AGAR|nr:hypothetical protein EV421DRAFT_1966409 [Armillaria borealis]
MNAIRINDANVSSSLEGLTLLLPVTEWRGSHLADLRHLSRLRSIRTSLYFDRFHLIDEGLFHGRIPWVEDIILEVVLCPYDAFILPHVLSDWQELDHILASHPWKYSILLELYVDYNSRDPSVEDYCYDEWSRPGDLHEHSREFSQYEGLHEMNGMGRLHFEIKKRATNRILRSVKALVLFEIRTSAYCHDELVFHRTVTSLLVLIAATTSISKHAHLNIHPESLSHGQIHESYETTRQITYSDGGDARGSSTRGWRHTIDSSLQRSDDLMALTFLVSCFCLGELRDCVATISGQPKLQEAPEHALTDDMTSLHGSPTSLLSAELEDAPKAQNDLPSANP